MKSIIFAFSLLCSTLLAAQSQPPLISLQGTASRKITPDVAVFNFEIRSKGKLENEAITNLNKNANNLLNKLVSAGFSKEQITISNFYLHEDHIYTEGMSRKIGYIAGQSLQLRIPYDKEKLGNLLTKLSAERSEDVTLNFGTDISKGLEESTRNELLDAAIKDARGKAEIMARAAGLTLGSVYRIDYNQNTGGYPPPVPMYKEMAMAGNQRSDSFESLQATALELRETVGVSYTFK